MNTKVGKTFLELCSSYAKMAHYLPGNRMRSCLAAGRYGTQRLEWSLDFSDQDEQPLGK